MAKLKVWGGLVFTDQGRQVRTIVCAPSQRRAVELLTEKCVSYITLYEFRGFWSVTANTIELETATGEGVWMSQNRIPEGPGDYRRME